MRRPMLRQLLPQTLTHVFRNKRIVKNVAEIEKNVRNVRGAEGQPQDSINKTDLKGAETDWVGSMVELSDRPTCGKEKPGGRDNATENIAYLVASSDHLG